MDIVTIKSLRHTHAQNIASDIENYRAEYPFTFRSYTKNKKKLEYVIQQAELPKNYADDTLLNEKTHQLHTNKLVEHCQKLLNSRYKTYCKKIDKSNAEYGYFHHEPTPDYEAFCFENSRNFSFLYDLVPVDEKMAMAACKDMLNELKMACKGLLSKINIIAAIECEVVDMARLRSRINSDKSTKLQCLNTMLSRHINDINYHLAEDKYFFIHCHGVILGQAAKMISLQENLKTNFKNKLLKNFIENEGCKNKKDKTLAEKKFNKTYPKLPQIVEIKRFSSTFNGKEKSFSDNLSHWARYSLKFGQNINGGTTHLNYKNNFQYTVPDVIFPDEVLMLLADDESESLLPTEILELLKLCKSLMADDDYLINNYKLKK